MRSCVWISALLLAAAPAGAVTVRLGGVAAPGEGLVSGRAGVVEERFNGASLATCTSTTMLRRGSFSSSDSNDRFAGSVANLRRQPGDATNASCYLTTPVYSSFGGNISGTNYSIEDPYLFDAGGVATHYIEYLGFHWGSIDPYNIFRLRTEDATTFVTEGGVLLATSDVDSRVADLRGDVLIAAVPGMTAFNSHYIEFLFDFATDGSPNFFQLFNEFGIPAFELDNIAIGYAPIPQNIRPAVIPSLAVEEAPAAALLAAAALALARRRRARR